MTIIDQRCVRRVVLRIFAVGCAVGFGIVGLGILAGAAWRWRLHQEVEGRLRAIRDAGLPTRGEELNQWYAAVPDRENAALVLTQAFALLRNYPDERSNTVGRIILPARGGQLDLELIEMVAGDAEINASALAKAREAVALPRCRYPIDCGLGVDVLLPHLEPLKMLARRAEFEGQVAIQGGRPVASLESTMLILGLARTLDEEPVGSSQSTRVALVKIAISNLERAMAAFTFADKDLARVSLALARTDRTNLVQRALVGERAVNAPRFKLTWAKLKRICEEDKQGPSFDWPFPDVDREPDIVRISGIVERDLNFYLRAMETNVMISGWPESQRLATTNLVDSIADEASRSYCMFSSWILPSLHRSFANEAEGLARVRAAYASVAVERFRGVHGRLPKTLNDLAPRFLTVVPADPFDGNPLRYKELKCGYGVYSIGRDGRDDGGRELPKPWPNGGLAPGSKWRGLRGAGGRTNWVIPPEDITFTVER